MCCPSAEFEKERPVTAKTIECFWGTSGAVCCVFVFLVAPIAVIVLVEMRKISPWWLFLGCGPLVLLLCLCVGCFVCALIGMIVFENCVPRPAKKNKPITEAATDRDDHNGQFQVRASKEEQANQSNHSQPLAMCCPSEEFENQHPVTARTIKYFRIGLITSGSILVFVAAPIAVTALVALGKISPWWLFLGCGPLVLLACVCCCTVGLVVLFGSIWELDEKNKQRSKTMSLENKAITQINPV
ncbi:hypothetical protein DdX_12614 [Ditylenchus destructor]|uniref:Uncharacterized protein n=1 Tax=Ditylenchus destructor TaxID=166010 RepID=A0AAD4MV10_9BILA|nr:hypothetical protein DdX_12614 [Ditylenchus destructor]